MSLVLDIENHPGERMTDPKPAVDCYCYAVGWSFEDEVYIARVLDWPGLVAHGDSQEEALSIVRNLVEVSIEDCLKPDSGELIPAPMGDFYHQRKADLINKVRKSFAAYSTLAKEIEQRYRSVLAKEEERQEARRRKEKRDALFLRIKENRF